MSIGTILAVIQAAPVVLNALNSKNGTPAPPTDETVANATTTAATASPYPKTGAFQPRTTKLGDVQRGIAPKPERPERVVRTGRIHPFEDATGVSIWVNGGKPAGEDVSKVIVRNKEGHVIRVTEIADPTTEQLRFHNLDPDQTYTFAVA